MKLAENIRTLRKERMLTQEQLAQMLGVTVGAVYKWESGRSTPEVSLLMEMAELFGISVDALLGFELRSNAVKAMQERIRAGMVRKEYQAASEEAERALKRYPNDFGIVYWSAGLYQHWGLEQGNTQAIRTALVLLERAIALLSQNTDPEISETGIRYQTALCYQALGDLEKSIEILKQYNVCGVHNPTIGMTCASSKLHEPEEAIPFLTKAFLQSIQDLIQTMWGYTTVYLRKGDHATALEALRWLISYLKSVRAEDAEVSFVDKVLATYQAVAAHLLSKLGQNAEAEMAIREACRLAQKFDAAPNYSYSTMKFCDGSLEKVSLYDDLGQTAMEAVENALYGEAWEKCTADVAAMWENLKKQGQHPTDG